jgi:hypothetical protein
MHRRMDDVSNMEFNSGFAGVWRHADVPRAGPMWAQHHTCTVLYYCSSTSSCMKRACNLGLILLKVQCSAHSEASNRALAQSSWPTTDHVDLKVGSRWVICANWVGQASGQVFVHALKQDCKANQATPSTPPTRCSPTTAQLQPFNHCHHTLSSRFGA